VRSETGSAGARFGVAILAIVFGSLGCVSSTAAQVRQDLRGPGVSKGDAPQDALLLADSEKTEALFFDNFDDASLAEPPGDDPASIVQVLKLWLPAEFTDTDLGEALTVSSQPTTQSEPQACSPLTSEADDGLYSFECQGNESGIYAAALLGFEPLTLRVEPERDALVATIDDDDLVSTAAVSVVPVGGTIPDDAAFIVLGADWQEVLRDTEAVASRVFESIDADATGVTSACPPTDRRLPIGDLIRDQPQLAIEVDCHFTRIDRAGLPAGLGDVTLSGCAIGEDLGSFCLRAPADAGLPVRLQLSEDSPWQTESVAAGTTIALADLLVFPEGGALLDGTPGLSFGGLSVGYEVMRATLAGDGGTCRTMDAFGTPVVFAGKPLSDFACGDIAPDHVELQLRRREGGPEGFRQTVDLTLPLADLLTNHLPSGRIALVALTLDIDPGESHALPAFFEMRLFATVAECEAHEAPLVGLNVTSQLHSVEIGEPLLADAAVYQLLNGDQPMTRCTLLDEAVLEPEADGAMLTASLPIEFIRPTGSYSIIVLVPTENMEDQGWRGVLNQTLRDQVSVLAQRREALTTDFFQVTESGALRRVIAGEDYLDLPATGGANSIQGRFDTIQYIAATSQPLASINLVEANTADTEIDTVLLIVDSRDEQFQPRDSGSLYHWLINREIKLKIISLGKCDEWSRLTVNLDNKIECYDLEDIAGEDAAARADAVAEVLRNYGFLEVD
jgi:hypothetical protein